MRALCGAIITAGALIGLGLTALGIGTRYQGFARFEESLENHFVKFKELDTALILCVVVLLCMTVIGLGISFMGLAYHHHRRLHEMTRGRSGSEQDPGIALGR
jgi:hypothetical protein